MQSVNSSIFTEDGIPLYRHRKYDIPDILGQGQKFFNHDFSKILLYMILLVLNCFLIIILQALTTFAIILLAFNVDKITKIYKFWG